MISLAIIRLHLTEMDRSQTFSFTGVISSGSSYTTDYPPDTGGMRANSSLFFNIVVESVT